MRTRFDNCLLFDGTGCPSTTANVTVEGDRIVSITGPTETLPRADKMIDLKGFALCPGFIDTHSHSDLAIFEDPMVAPKLRQGITTEIFGQDGISMAPLPPEYISPWRQNIAGLEGTNEHLDWNYRTTQGYLKLLHRAGVGVNICYLVPHGNIRMEAMGLEGRPASNSEIERMCTLLKRELDSGGCGLSTGLIYPPCTYSDEKELTALCTVAARQGVPLVIHQRSEADSILESMTEVLNIGRRTGVHVHFSHFKICGKYNDHKFPKVLEMLDDAAAAGLKVTFDQYPYVAGSTMLSAILPPWAHEGGTGKMLSRLADRKLRQQMVNDIKAGPSDWDNFVAFAGTEGISITHVQHKKDRETIGKTLDEIAEIRGLDPVEAALDLILQQENGVSMVDFYGLETHVRGFMARPEMNVCTDGLMHGTPHPRTFGAFPRVLGHYSRDEGIMPMTEAVRKMTLQPATVFNIEQRGKIAEGWYADLVVFDPADVKDVATYTEPRQHPDGIELVMVNGQISYASEQFQSDDLSPAYPSGRVLALSD